MHIYLKKLSITLISIVLLTGCIGSKLTPQQENRLGEQQSRKVLSKVRLSSHPTFKKRLRNVSNRIARISNKPSFRWKHYLVANNKTANAFVLPGGKIFVYTGLFKYASNEAELAAVIGHEVAHALKSHGIASAQRAQGAQLVGALLQVGMQVAGVDANTANIAKNVYAKGATFGFIRPKSRTQELESDAIGLMLMAKAGYNPKAALSFWEKFGKASHGTAEFLSTHPAPRNRIAQLRKLMPQAMAIYNKRR